MAYLCLYFSPWSHPEKFCGCGFRYNYQKKIKVLWTQNYLRHSTTGISENARKKVNIFKDIELKKFNSIEYFFLIYKNSIFFLCPDVTRFFFILKDETLKKIISEGRGFRGGSDKKMRRMWLGVEIDGACLPSLILLDTYTHIRQN